MGRIYNSEEFNELPDDGRQYELSEGRLTNRKLPNDVQGRIVRRISNYLFIFDPKERLGTAWLSTTFEMGLTWITVPDLAFMIATRVPRVSEDYVKGIPDLVVEVLSSTNSDKPTGRSTTKNKILKYLNYGVRIVWAIDPRNKIVEVYHKDRVIPVRC